MKKVKVSRRKLLATGLMAPFAGLSMVGCSEELAVERSSVVDCYLDRTSVYPGDTLTLYANASDDSPGVFHVYDIAGKVVFTQSFMGQKQVVNTDNPVAEGYGYAPTLRFDVPADLPPGMYFIENLAWFNVKSRRLNPICIVYGSNTEHAYNAAGGGSLYLPKQGDFDAVSFLRPPKMNNFDYYNRSFYEWIHQSEFAAQCSYLTDPDLDDEHALDECRILVVPGHSEYWTRSARRHVDAFVARGGHLVILSGNTMWWQVRYTDDQKTMVCYKSKSADPIADTLLKTDLWVDPTLEYPIIDSIGLDFRLAGYGLKTGKDKGWNGFKITRADNYIFNGTGLRNGEILQLPSTEADGTLLSGFDANGYPLVDIDGLGFQRATIYGFDYVFMYNEFKYPENPVNEQVAVIAAFQKTQDGGVIFAAATTNWCGTGGMASINKAKVMRITRNVLYALMNGIDIF